ncbi:ferredoxin [Pseudoroseicyclus sp. CXY001]|uniref:ferredoxin n=1 Tax=Pseudoroseicyclus sp. CXY001 TaxID=3242492 RepID=UPI00357125D0
MRLPAEQEALAAALKPQGLRLAGACAPEAEDGLGREVRSILLVSPDEPAFWPVFAGSPERADGLEDPLDRWSARVLGAVARAHGASAVYPFGGPPYRPFIRWAERSGRAYASPVTLLVDGVAGLFFSARGALLVGWEAALPPLPSPCPACPQPCRSACPAGALTPAGYDVARCHRWLDSDAGSMCMEGGCLVRRACPVGAGLRLPAQSEFHMKAFHP